MSSMRSGAHGETSLRERGDCSSIAARADLEQGGPSPFPRAGGGSSSCPAPPEELGCSAVAPALNELAEFQKSLEASCRASFQQLSDRLELMEERQRRLARHCGFREDLVRLSSASSAPCAGSIKASWRPAGSTELYAQRPCRAGGGGAPRQPRPSSVSSATAAAGRAAAGSAAAKASAEAWTQTSSGDLGRVQTSAAPRRGKKPKRPKPAPSSSPRPGWDRLAQTSRRPLRASSLTGRAGPALSAYDLLAMLDAPHQLVF
mmetsp:Transcript_17781/g.28501  ORF Transcript_17781/g.28501 Transcript_17781/m.28501 type:complete len:261 (+) Transcript_17781:56-838(+)